MSIATEITRISTAKEDIRQAIISKGVTVPSSATIDSYDDYIDQIAGGGGGGGSDPNLIPFYCVNISSDYEQWTFYMEFEQSTETATLKYSIDNENWITLHTFTNTSKTKKISVSAGTKVYFKCDKTYWNSGPVSFGRITGMRKVGGNVMSLMYGDNFTGSETSFPATGSKGCGYMFEANTTLEYADELILPATTLNPMAYFYMFKNCTSLKTAPELPATTLASGCYAYMFYECSSLEKAPKLPATTLVSQCYYYMFYHCSSLNYINAAFTTAITSDTNYTSAWTNSVAAKGLFIKNPEATWTLTGTSGIPTNWITVNYEIPNDVIDNSTPFFAENPSGSSMNVTISSISNNNVSITIETSTDLVNWTTAGTHTYGTMLNIAIPANTRVYFRANTSAWGASTTNASAHNISANINMIFGGNVMSLLCGENFTGNETELPSGAGAGALGGLFYNSNIVDASRIILPLTSFSQFGTYKGMFYNCTKLLYPPKLPATSVYIYSYQSMFEGCTSLVKAPELPATTINDQFGTCACYARMFYGCTSLKEAPELPAITIKSDCYKEMFYGCTSLVKAPSKLPATTVAYNCYESMFQKCSSLTTAPELPATTLDKDGCYKSMFMYCTKLNYIKAMFTTTPNNTYTQNWVYSVDTAGIFIKSSSSSWTTVGTNAMPAGWSTKKV
jgi:hypothetical protein